VIFKSSDAAVPQGDLNGFLDRGSHLEGELRFETSFRIDGRVTGRVSSPGSLMVGDGGEVDGEVEVGRLFVSGVLRGAVKATARIQIAPGGKVYADLVTPSLVIEDGAIFEGRCAMTGEPRAAAEPKGKMAEEAAAAAKPKLVSKAAG
jgi:cytoskeletal protein CcmA (bactofilin family)